VHLHNLLKKIIFTGLLMVTLPSFSMTIYSVKSGDSLWKVATKHKIKGVSNSEMIKAIRGINSKEYPSINDNIISINQKLSIPTTAAEAEDGIKLYTLRHTKYLKPKNTATQNNSTDETKSTDTSINDADSTLKDIDTASQDNEETHPHDNEDQGQPTAYDIAHADQNNATPITVSENPEVQNSGTVVTPMDTATEKTTPTDDTQQKKSNKLLWIILIALVLVIIWGYRRRNFKSLTETQQIKDQFYEKRMTIPASSESTKTKTDKKLTNIKEIIAKADQFIEQQDIAQAKAVLQEALNYSPKDLDIRIKLLAVYAADNDQISFNSERDYLAANLLPYDDKRWKSIDALYRKHFSL